MKRPWAFICASEGATSKHLRNYCREVYLLGYLPVCPKLQDSQYLVLEDAVERSECTTLCAIVRECAQADFHKDYTYNRQAYAAPSYCAAYMVAHRYGLDTTAFNFDRVVALYRNLGTEQQRGFLSDVNIVGGGLLRSLSRTLAVQTRELPTAEYAVAVPSAKKQSRQQERG